MKIRKTRGEDLNRITGIYAYARSFMSEHGNPNQWGPTNWPPEELIKKDIEKGLSFVCENESGTEISLVSHDVGRFMLKKTIIQGLLLRRSEINQYI